MTAGANAAQDNGMTSLDLLPCQRDCYLTEGQGRVLRWGLRQCNSHTLHALIVNAVHTTAALISTFCKYGIPCVPRFPLYFKLVACLPSRHEWAKHEIWLQM